MRIAILVLYFVSYHSWMWGQKFEVERLPASINSTLEEISPIVSTDGNTLIFTRIGSTDFNRSLMEYDIDLSKTLAPEEYMRQLGQIYSTISGQLIMDPVTSRFNQDVFIAQTTSTRFNKMEHPGYPLNNALPNSICSTMPESDEYVIANQFDPEGGMSIGFSTIKRKADGQFEFPVPIEIADFYTRSEEVGFSMAPDGNAIIMSLDRPDSYGSLDLYVAFRIDKHYFSRPINLGPAVNSRHREIAPYVSTDNNRLFFTSNRGERGDFDIYTIMRQEYSWQNWSDIKRLPEPINSTADDTQPFLVEQTDELFFVSNRNGNSDIYRASLIPEVEKDIKQLAIQGIIIDADTKKPIRATLNYGPDEQDELDKFFNSFSGSFQVNLVFKDNYRFSAEKIGYLSAEIILDPDMFAEVKSNYQMVIELSPIKKKRLIEINNLEFEQSKAILMPNSKPELNRLYRILKRKKNLSIRVEGHTDNIGDGDAKMELSEDRAKAVKQYLVDKGISKRRIDTEGYGDTRPLNDNSTEAKRIQNRRVEIRIIKKDK